MTFSTYLSLYTIFALGYWFYSLGTESTQPKNLWYLLGGSVFVFIVWIPFILIHVGIGSYKVAKALITNDLSHFGPNKTRITAPNSVKVVDVVGPKKTLELVCDLARLAENNPDVLETFEKKGMKKEQVLLLGKISPDDFEVVEKK